MERRPIPAPPPPPTEPQPPGGTPEWARWHLRWTFSPDDSAILEYLILWPQRHQRLAEYAVACHLRKWAGWQASLAWGVIEALTERWPVDDDIPF